MEVGASQQEGATHGGDFPSGSTQKSDQLLLDQSPPAAAHGLVPGAPSVLLIGPFYRPGLPWE